MLALALPVAADARVTRITADPPTTVDIPAFGSTGAYQKITGTFEGEIDPNDRRNAVIADIDLAPQVQGKVQYESTFFILRPVDLAKGNRKIFYDFGNRGHKRVLQWLNDGTATNDPTTAAHFGNGFLMREGYTVALNGWIGDAQPGPNIMSVDLPIARNSDGTSITGKVEAENVAGDAEDTSIDLPYETNSSDVSNGVLTVRERQTDPRQEVAGWMYANSRQVTSRVPPSPAGSTSSSTRPRTRRSWAWGMPSRATSCPSSSGARPTTSETLILLLRAAA